jgi:hypothetical protein
VYEGLTGQAEVVRPVAVALLLGGLHGEDDDEFGLVVVGNVAAGHGARMKAETLRYVSEGRFQGDPHRVGRAGIQKRYDASLKLGSTRSVLDFNATSFPLDIGAES